MYKTPYGELKMHSSKCKKTAFTLIELLVVIAIVSLLVAILLPSLKSAQELAKRVVCQSNIRQLLLSSAMYRADNQGDWHPACWDMGSGVYTNWYSNIFLGSYLATPSIADYRCPSTDDPDITGSIGYSLTLGPDQVSNQYFPYVNESMVLDPSAVPAFMDIYNHTYFSTASWLSGPTGEFTKIAMEPRHIDTGNVGYCDGHVSALEFDVWLRYGGYPEKWLCPWILH